MNAESYWQQFTSSGKIEDYLTYSRAKEEQNTNCTQERKEGERPYAGSNYGDRNDFKSDAYR